MSIVSSLIIAWILTYFGLDTILISAINEVAGKDYSTNVYWLIAAIIGVIGTFIELIFHKSNN